MILSTGSTKKSTNYNNEQQLNHVPSKYNTYTCKYDMWSHQNVIQYFQFLTIISPVRNVSILWIIVKTFELQQTHLKLTELNEKKKFDELPTIPLAAESPYILCINRHTLYFNLFLHNTSYLISFSPSQVQKVIRDNGELNY